MLLDVRAHYVSNALKNTFSKEIRAESGQQDVRKQQSAAMGGKKRSESQKDAYLLLLTSFASNFSVCINKNAKHVQELHAKLCPLAAKKDKCLSKMLAR
jgi:hypothetical protein